MRIKPRSLVLSPTRVVPRTVVDPTKDMREPPNRSCLEYSWDGRRPKTNDFGADHG